MWVIHEGFTITGAQATGQNGGGLRIYGRLMLKDCVVTGNVIEEDPSSVWGTAGSPSWGMTTAAGSGSPVATIVDPGTRWHSKTRVSRSTSGMSGWGRRVGRMILSDGKC